MIDRRALLNALASVPDRRPPLRWLRTPLGGGVATIVLAAALVAVVRDRRPPGRVYTMPAHESPAWRAAMMRLEKAARLRSAGEQFAERGHADGAQRLLARAAAEFDAFAETYPDDEKVSDRRFVTPRALLAAGRCRTAREERAICERVWREWPNEPVAILASLRWCAIAEAPASDDVGARLDAAMKLVEQQKGAFEKVADVMAHSRIEALKRMVIEEMTGTSFATPAARAETNFRLGEWHLARGRRAEALAHFERAVESPEWTKRAEERARGLRTSVGSGKPDEFKVERIGK